MEKGSKSNFSRIVDEDGKKITTDIENDVYKFTIIDNLYSNAQTNIELKDNTTAKIIRQLVSDLSFVKNKINLIMTVLDQLSDQDVIPKDIIKTLAQSLNTIDQRNSKQK